jgi:hypothetical protein
MVRFFYKYKKIEDGEVMTIIRMLKMKAISIFIFDNSHYQNLTKINSLELVEIENYKSSSVRLKSDQQNKLLPSKSRSKQQPSDRVVREEK